MITESQRERIYREVESRAPIWRPPLAEDGPIKGLSRRPRLMEPGLTDNITALKELEFQRLRDGVLERILFELYSVFEIPAESARVEEAVRQILDDRFAAELACGTSGAYDAGVYARCLFFDRWNRTAGEISGDGEQPSAWIKGLSHIRGAGFFRKSPREILGWTRCFLEVEGYHRLDPVHNEERLDRYRVLRTGGDRPAITHFEDVLIWLDLRLMGQTDGGEGDIGRLSREIAMELEGAPWDALLPDSPVQPALYVLLRCHQLCLMETLDMREQKRLLQIQANRQIDSLLDLMRLVLHKTVGEARLPDPSALLDELQSEGFNIEHQRFRDPYEALLVPIEESQRFEEATLRLLVSLDQLTGDWERDRLIGLDQVEGWYHRLIREAVQDVASFVLSERQPLPQTGLMHRIVRTAATLVLARRAWPPQTEGDGLEGEVRKALPEGAVKHLIRPRKGYELKSRADLGSLIAGESSRQREALQRIAADHSIQGLHDFRHFIRYLLFQGWIERFGPDPAAWVAPLGRGELADRESRTMDWVAEAAARWSLDLHRAVPHSLEAVQDHLEEICPRSVVIDRVTDGFVLSQGEKGRIYRSLIDEITPVCHRLLVAYGRSWAGMDRIALSPGWRQELEPVVGLLAPTVHSLRDGAGRRVERFLADFAGPLYRSDLRLCLRSASEWKAFLAWEVHRWVEEHGGVLDEPGGLDRLRTHLESSAASVDTPPRTLFSESVPGSLIELISSNGRFAEIPREHLEAIVSLLPRIDCGACGRSSCRAFAMSLAAGRLDPGGCVHLAAHQVEGLKLQLSEIQRVTVPGGGGNPLDVLRDRAKWRASPERRSFEKVLSVTEQKGRQFIRERMKSLWERQSPKPRIFKAPSGEELYRGLCLYLGYEAAERLQRDERQLLVDHGDFRLDADWERVVQSRDWLVLARRRRQSQPLAQSQEPTWKAREAYRKVLFLHQLSPRDRDLVLRHRFERFQDGFSHWWNEDLLDMNLPDFSIRDWADFSKIIKNAYWHQEASLAAGRVPGMLQEAAERGTALLPPDVAPVQMLEAYLERLIRQEQADFEHRRKVRADHRQGLPVRDFTQLRQLLEACIDEVGPGESSGSPEDERKLWLEQVWRRFQTEGFSISPGLSCTWEELLPDEQDIVEEEFARVAAAISRSGPGALVMGSRDQSLRERSTFLRSLLSAALMRRQQERMESDWLETKLRERSPGRPPLGIIRLLVRERVRRGIDRSGIQQELKAHLGGAAAYPGLIDAWCGDLLHHLACKRQYQVSLGIPALGSGEVEADDMDSVLHRFPVFTAFLDRLLDRFQPVDRDRLLHYLFLVAKMEGNLDALTALLREIRETSDVIEAAWLRFTEQRLQEGPLPRPVPGSSLGIPLLVSGLKDREPVNRGLRDGMGRGEKRQVAAAYRELLEVVRYHVLLQDQERGSLEEVLDDIRRAGYDLGGIDEGALAAAAEREWNRRESLREQRIWIYASVTARLFAAQHAELQEVDRAFHKVRMDLLKDEGMRPPVPPDGASRALPGAEAPGAGKTPSGIDLADVVSRRGVALGQIKEEMYRRLSDLLEAERMATFHKRIRQIIEELDRKRIEIQEEWYRGRIDSRAVFYLLRQHQKGEEEPGWDDFWQFVVDHGLNPLDELMTSRRPDREQRLRELDDRFRALLGISLLQWKEEVAAAARQDLQAWMEERQRTLA
ncbi:MAG: hypothetical protein MUC41_04795 [Syntrophobacteraceae bacterium]|nr:hypothetical protein [Syntrophobacteraceae bacterium]